MLGGPGSDPLAVDRHTAVGGLAAALNEVLDLSASISSSRMASAAWLMSIIVAGWKCATVPATASRRWNVSRRGAEWRKLSPSAELMVDPGCGARCAIRDIGAPGERCYHWTVTVFGETDPVAAGRIGEIEETRRAIG